MKIFHFMTFDKCFSITYKQNMFRLYHKNEKRVLGDFFRLKSAYWFAQANYNPTIDFKKDKEKYFPLNNAAKAVCFIKDKPYLFRGEVQRLKDASYIINLF